MNDITLVQTGIPGLDNMARGGFVPNRLYLVEGNPGSGKTTLALQFLLEGVRLGETCMFVSLSESGDELRATAKSHGWSLDGITILEIIASEKNLTAEVQYMIFHPSEVELGETTQRVLAETERVKPVRLVFDSLSELRLLAENSLRYRRQILALKQHFAKQECTVLFVDDRTAEEEMHLHSLAHGVISLERHLNEYGTMRRRIQITKLRGRAFREGYHDYVIRTGGLEVFPRLIASESRAPHTRQTIPSGIGGLDTLLGGGLTTGTSTLIVGAVGTGKSSLATRYALTTAERGEHATLFLFDEAIPTVVDRSAGLGMDLKPGIQAGRINLRQIDPAELSPGEFAHVVMDAVIKDKSRLIVIDSLTGYLNAMPSERFLSLHLHELLTCLGQHGVITLLVMAQHGIVGADPQSPIDTSYLADTVILMRYFEALGEVRQAISVIKKRTGNHEHTIREFRLAKGITIGEPITDFQGVLTGVPVFVRK